MEAATPRAAMDVSAPTFPGPLRRDEVAACAVLLLAFVALRVAAARALAFDLLEPEELINLRLLRQLQAGYPAGDLGRYWYTGVGGSTGAGPLVLSVLYLLLGPFVEADVAAGRLMGTLWAVGGALLLGAIGRRLLGRGGAAAGLAAALAMPPTWLAWSLTARGNYMEAAVLTLLGAWLLLRLAAARGARAASAWAAGLGVALAFAGWFCVSAVPPSLLLLVIAPLALGRRWTAWAALLAGLLVGSSPLLLGLRPATVVPSPVGAGEVREVLLSVLGAPSAWPRVVAGSMDALPVLGYGQVPAEDWARGWQLALERPVLWTGWAGAGLLLLLGLGGPPLARRLGPAPPGRTERALVLVLAACALAIPPALASIGVAPDGLGVRQLYWYDARRAALVYPVMALGVAIAGRAAWRWRPGRWLILAGLLFAVASAGTMAMGGGQEFPGAFHPGRYMLCPSEQPVDEASVCVDALWEDQVAVLEALVLRPELAPAEARRRALQGFGALLRDEDRCDVGAVPGGDLASFGLGAAAATGCDPARAAEVCAGAPGPAACRDGMEWGAAFRLVGEE